MTQAKILKPAETTYRGTITDPDRWGHYNPRVGDVLVITPAKSGTTWTQSIVAMLLNGGPDLPAPVTELSPWVDANFFPVEDVFPRLEAIKGRRVIKTHTPADGYPVWDGVKTISVYRHPLEVVISLRKHVQNYKDSGDHPILAAHRGVRGMFRK